MPEPDIHVPKYPNVPVAPGVPPVARPPFSAIESVALLVADAVILGRLFQGPSWGIFQNGSPIITGDTTVRFGYRASARASDYPIEKGGFQSYNKVQNPFESRITFTCGGAFSINAITSAISATSVAGALQALTGETARTAFLNALDAAQQSLELYDVVTPEKTYTSANVMGFEYERTVRSGVTMITADVTLEEIRLGPPPSFANTQAPASTDPVNSGTVQTVPVTSTPQPSTGGLSTFKFQ